MIQNAIAVILGGGSGTRLYPLTDKRSKPAVSIGGKYRLIDIPISNCLNSGLRRMFVLTQFNSASLNQHIKRAYNFDIFSSGFVDILAAEQTRANQDWFQGTADAVRQCIQHFDHHKFDHVIILSGDQLYQMDLEAILEKHVALGSDLTVATIPVNADDAGGFGIMKVNEEEEIVDFIEKPSKDILSDWTSPLPEEHTSKGNHYLASMGIYVFSKNILGKLFKELPEAIDFGKEIIPFAVNSSEFKATSYPYGGYWTDIGTIKSYFEAGLALTQYLPEFNLFDNNKPVYTRARMLSPSKVFGTRFNHALISDGCIIHADSISNSLIGIRSRIGKETTIEETILLGNDYYQSLKDLSAEEETRLLGIGKNCTIKRAIVDKNVKIGDGVSIIGHDSLEDAETDDYCIREGIVILKKGATIPDNTKIGFGG